MTFNVSLRCSAEGQPGAGPVDFYDFYPKNCVGSTMESPKRARPPGTTPKWCKTMFRSGLKSFRCFFHRSVWVYSDFLWFFKVWGRRGRPSSGAASERDFRRFGKNFLILEGFPKGTLTGNFQENSKISKFRRGFQPASRPGAY